METWRKVWREGLADQLSTPGLEVLRSALIRTIGRPNAQVSAEPIAA